MAYTFFNAVNSSGKKLSDYDLLKAHHLRFIADEAVAKVMAEQWDVTGAGGYGDILHKTLYRLRSWSRHENPAVDAQIGHRLFNHFSAKAPTVSGIFFPPLAMRFNSTIPGGAPFFYYAERHRMLWDRFTKTGACMALNGHLSELSGNVLRDIICTLLFAFYCRFGEIYLNDALFCIADVVSALRNKPRVQATPSLRDEIIKDCLYSLDTALDPGRFFDWCLSPERQYPPDRPITPMKSYGVKNRYWDALGGLYGDLSKSAVLKEQIAKRRKMLEAPPSAENKKEG